MATKPAPKQAALAFVEIGLIDLLMPLPKALQLVELMQHAVTCNPHYGDSHKRMFIPGSTPDVSVVNVRPDQLLPATQPTNPRSRMSVPLSLPEN